MSNISKFKHYKEKWFQDALTVINEYEPLDIVIEFGLDITVLETYIFDCKIKTSKEILLALEDHKKWIYREDDTKVDMGCFLEYELLELIPLTLFKRRLKSGFYEYENLKEFHEKIIGNPSFYIKK